MTRSIQFFSVEKKNSCKNFCFYPPLWTVERRSPAICYSVQLGLGRICGLAFKQTRIGQSGKMFLEIVWISLSCTQSLQVPYLGNWSKHYDLQRILLPSSMTVNFHQQHSIYIIVHYLTCNIRLCRILVSRFEGQSTYKP